MEICVYTDGSCFVNQNIGGWGVYMMLGNNKTIEFSGSCKCKEPVYAELFAIVKSLEYISSFILHVKPLNIKLYTDCDYFIKLIKQKNKLNKTNFPLRDKTSKKNKRLLFEICNYQENIDSIEWIAVKSHSGIKGNEIADQLAKNAAKKAIKKTDI